MLLVLSTYKSQCYILSNICYYCKLTENIIKTHNCYSKDDVIIPLVKLSNANVNALSQLCGGDTNKLLSCMYLYLDVVLKNRLDDYKATILDIEPDLINIYAKMYNTMTNINTCGENIYSLSNYHVQYYFNNADAMRFYTNRYEELINIIKINADPSIYKFNIQLKFMQSPMFLCNARSLIAHDLYDKNTKQYRIEQPKNNYLSPKNNYLASCCIFKHDFKSMMTDIELAWTLYLLFINIDDLSNFFINIKSDTLYYDRCINGTQLKMTDLMVRLDSIKKELIEFQ